MPEPTQEAQPIARGVARALRFAAIPPRWHRWLARLGPLLLFALLIAPAGWRYRNWVNADGTFYIRKAMYIRRGLFDASISAYWSPGLSWCVAALIGPNTSPVGGLHAARLVLAGFGLLYVAAAGALLRRLLGPGRLPLAAWGAAAIAIGAVPLAAFKITPDLLLGAALLAYLAVVARADFLSRPWLAAAAGAAAGAGFLCKAYALPFFLAHFAMTLIWHAWNAYHAAGAPDRPPNRRGPVVLPVLRAGCIALAALALLAVPWITVVSGKYHRVVVSTVMAYNHAAVGPPEVLHQIPDAYVVPKAPYFTHGETPDDPQSPDWSPFESRAYFIQQLRVIVAHIGRTAFDQVLTDFSGLTLLAWLVALAIGASALWTRRPIPGCTWVAATIAVYCSGFLIVAYETRYVVPMLLPLGVTICLATWAELPPWWGIWRRAPAAAARLSQSRVWVALPVVILGLYAAAGAVGQPDMPGSAVLIARKYHPIYATVAEQINELGLPPDRRIASSDVPRGNCVAYLLDRGEVAFPSDHNMRVLAQKMKTANVGVLIIWEVASDEPPDMHQTLVAKFVHKARWRRARAIHMSDKFQANLFVPRGLAFRPPTTRGASPEPPAPGPAALSPHAG